jgi:hypothetical protein
MVIVFCSLPGLMNFQISFRLQLRPGPKIIFSTIRRILGKIGFSNTMKALESNRRHGLKRVFQSFSVALRAILGKIPLRHQIRGEYMKFLYPLLAGLLAALALAPSALAGEKTIVGWIEKVRIYPGNFVVHAKLDSGAEYSSLDAGNLTVFDRDGKPWVRFDLEEKREGKKLTIERPLLRWAPIKRHNQEPQRRPVIKMGVCLGTMYKETEVNLINRKNYQYRMLIGRKFMEGAVIIDPAAKYTVEPECKGAGRIE